VTTTPAPAAAGPLRLLRSHRPLVESLGYAALAVIAAALGLAGNWSVFAVVGAPPAAAWWSLATAAPACALVAVKTRAPLAALLAGTALAIVDLLTVGGLVTIVVLLDLLYTATLLGTPARRRRLLIGAAAGVGAVAATAFWLSGDLRATVLVSLQIGALLGAAYWWGTSVAQAHELVALHRQRAADAARLAERERAEAVDREREAMARELHDLVAGHVSAIAIRAEAALSASPGAPPDSAADRAALRAVRDSSLAAHRALRTMISVLRGAEPQPLAADRREQLPALVEDARRAGLDVAFEDAIARALPLPVDRALARIVRESLANCARHAAGGRVSIRLGEEEGAVRIAVDSREGAPLGRPELAGSGWGLELLRERVRALGGEFEAGPREGGWSVRARVPAEAGA